MDRPLSKMERACLTCPLADCQPESRDCHKGAANMIEGAMDSPAVPAAAAAPAPVVDPNVRRNYVRISMRNFI